MPDETDGAAGYGASLPHDHGEHDGTEGEAELASLWPPDLFADCEWLFADAADPDEDVPPGSWAHAWQRTRAPDVGE